MSNPDKDDDGTVSEADLKEAQERWAAEDHEPLVKEIFSKPVYGDGFRGDMPIDSKPKTDKK
jgi:hypothetical protein